MSDGHAPALISYGDVMFDVPDGPGPLARTVHAYPTCSVAVQHSGARFFFEIDGWAARSARAGGEG